MKQIGSMINGVYGENCRENWRWIAN